MLGIHAVCGAIWTGVALCFVAAAAFVGFGEGADADFVPRVAPRVAFVSILMAAFSLGAGVAVLGLVLYNADFELPTNYLVLMSVKIALFAAMAWTVAEARRYGARFSPRVYNVAATDLAKRRIVELYGVCTMLGLIALALGIWAIGR
jgi:putative copper export protein